MKEYYVEKRKAVYTIAYTGGDYYVNFSHSRKDREILTEMGP